MDHASKLAIENNYSLNILKIKLYKNKKIF